MSKPVCTLIGVGPGKGTAIARKFSSDRQVLASRQNSTSCSVMCEQPSSALYHHADPLNARVSGPGPFPKTYRSAPALQPPAHIRQPGNRLACFTQAKS